MKKSIKLSLHFAALLLLSCSLHAQNIRNLAFEGAGIRGLAYAGVIQELEKNGTLGNIEKVGGTSAGAIAALAVSLGYNGVEVEKVISEMRLQRFNDGRFFFIGGFSRLNRNYGWYRGRAFSEWLGQLIERKTGNENITFSEMATAGYRKLYITGTSLTNQKLIIFSAETYPNMRVKDAVRISMSIPLYFEAICIDEKGTVVDCHKSNGQSIDLMVDGGLTGNFPIEMFDSTTTSGQRMENMETLGIRIDSPDQILYDREAKGLAPLRISAFRNYVGAFYSFAIENLNRQRLTPRDWQRTISVSSGSIGPKIRKLSGDEKRELVSNGRQAVIEYYSR
jgi:NTE family protein